MGVALLVLAIVIFFIIKPEAFFLLIVAGICGLIFLCAVAHHRKSSAVDPTSKPKSADEIKVIIKQPAAEDTRREKQQTQKQSASMLVNTVGFSAKKLTSKKAFTDFRNYIVFDVETTGLSPQTDKIIEIAMLKCVNGEPVDQYHSLVNPLRQLPSSITRLTGLTDQDLRQAPVIGDLCEDILAFISGFPLVAHNASFDVGFLRSALVGHDMDGSIDYVDTLSLARRAYPDAPNHKLAALIEMLGLSDGQTHRAMDDVICTQKLLESCLHILLERKEAELAARRAERSTRSINSASS